MPVVRAAGTAIVRAPAPLVYRLIADYRTSHPRILPRRHFPRLEVERGGTGAGTMIRFEFRMFGMTREIRAEISEPMPGQVLVETDHATGARTTFTVTAQDDARACRVGIETQWNATGLRGWVERMTAPRLLRRIYAEELAMLAEVAEDAVKTAAAANRAAAPDQVR